MYMPCGAMFDVRARVRIWKQRERELRCWRNPYGTPRTILDRGRVATGSLALHRRSICEVQSSLKTAPKSFQAVRHSTNSISGGYGSLSRDSSHVLQRINYF